MTEFIGLNSSRATTLLGFWITVNPCVSGIPHHVVHIQRLAGLQKKTLIDEKSKASKYKLVTLVRTTSG